MNIRNLNKRRQKSVCSVLILVFLLGSWVSGVDLQLLSFTLFSNHFVCWTWERNPAAFLLCFAVKILAKDQKEKANKNTKVIEIVSSLFLFLLFWAVRLKHLHMLHTWISLFKSWPDLFYSFVWLLLDSSRYSHKLPLHLLCCIEKLLTRVLVWHPILSKQNDSSTKEKETSCCWGFKSSCRDICVTPSLSARNSWDVKPRLLNIIFLFSYSLSCLVSLTLIWNLVSAWTCLRTWWGLNSPLDILLLFFSSSWQQTRIWFGLFISY